MQTIIQLELDDLKTKKKLVNIKKYDETIAIKEQELNAIKLLRSDEIQRDLDYQQEIDFLERIFDKYDRLESEIDQEILEFIQPTGYHNEYSKGDKVYFGDKIYQSEIDNNVWSPVSYPQGWKEVVS